MSKRHNIKKLYKPIQPTVANDNRVSYAEVNSSPLLSNYIFCYWQLQTLDKLNENFTYQVVSDGCIDIFWEVDKPQLNFITGFSNQYTEFPLSNHFNYFGIRFLPTSFPALFNINAAELTNRFEVLDTVISSLAKDIYNLVEGISSLEDLKPILDILLLKEVNNSVREFDTRINSAIELILKSKGAISIENGIDAGLSPRQLRRLFNFYIGDTPKVFSKVVRFQSLLCEKLAESNLINNKLYFDLGYYDQTHFIKEFKHLYGLTPTKAFS